MTAPDFLFRLHATNGIYLGTGILVSPLHILTCTHVLNFESPVEARRGAQKFTATVVARSPETADDLALLKVDDVLGDPPAWRHAVSDGASIQLKGFAKVDATESEFDERPDKVNSPATSENGWTKSAFAHSGAAPGMSGGIAWEQVGLGYCVGLIQLGGKVAHRTILIGPGKIARFLAPHGVALAGCPSGFPIADIDHESRMRDLHRQRVRSENSTVELKGFKGTNAHTTFPIQDFYVPLSNPNGKSLEQVFRRDQCLVVEGMAGSGKSTFLKHLAWTLAAEPDKFPVPIKVVALDATINGLLGRHPKVCQPSDPRWLAIHAAGKDWERRQDFMERQLARPGAVVLLDGFDEALDERHRARLRELLQSAQDEYPDCRFVLTSRPGVYGGTRTVPNFHTDSVRPLSKDDRTVFFRNWCNCAYRDNPSEGEAKREDLSKQVEGNPAIREMAASPMMLTALAVIHWNEGRLPEDRVKVYESIVGWMVFAKLHQERTLNPEQRLALLQVLAYGMQTEPTGRLTRAERGQALQILLPSLKGNRQAANDFLNQEEPDSGIIVGLADDDVQFRHLTLQEYLASQDLWNNTQDEQDCILTDPRRYGQHWREFLNLFALGAKKQSTIQRIYAKLLGAAKNESLANKARTVSMIRGMVRHRRERETDIESPLYMEFVRAMFGLFQGKADGENLDPFARADAAEAWELLVGDTSRLRLPSDHDYWEPIAGGQGLGRNPVTVHEYGHYLARNKSASVPKTWKEQESFPHRPVVYVSFHDAVAYCKWWSAETGKAIRLPGDYEWQNAAAGEYSWGDEEPDYDRANYDWKIKRPTPVGLFPKGNVPRTQIADMAGNVWEWGHEQVVRGGSFLNDSWYLRAAVRNFVVPDVRNYILGFRCLRAVFP